MAGELRAAYGVSGDHSHLSSAELRMLRICDGVARVRWLRAALLSPVIARPGYAFATACAWIWGAALHLSLAERRGGVILCAGLPDRAFGRGGTTIGAVYLTRNNVSESVLGHEAVHRAQWKHYGLAFIPLYIAAGSDARHNRFEIAAGLREGGYL